LAQAAQSCGCPSWRCPRPGRGPGQPELGCSQPMAGVELGSVSSLPTQPRCDPQHKAVYRELLAGDRAECCNQRCHLFASSSLTATCREPCNPSIQLRGCRATCSCPPPTLERGFRAPTAQPSPIFTAFSQQTLQKQRPRPRFARRSKQIPSPRDQSYCKEEDRQTDRLRHAGHLHPAQGCAVTLQEGKASGTRSGTALPPRGWGTLPAMGSSNSPPPSAIEYRETESRRRRRSRP